MSQSQDTETPRSLIRGVLDNAPQQQTLHSTRHLKRRSTGDVVKAPRKTNVADTAKNDKKSKRKSLSGETPRTLVRSSFKQNCYQLSIL